MVLKEKTGFFARFRRGKTNKLDDDQNAKSIPESATPRPPSESPTLADDTDTIPINNDIKNTSEGEVATSQLKAVRFPASDALKSTPGRTRWELPKPPTAREAAFGGPPRYDWIDIVSIIYPQF